MMDAAIEWNDQVPVAGDTARKTPLVVVLATGAEDGGKRATLAFSAACTALGLDQAAQLFLVGEGAYWAYEGRWDDVQIAGFPALEELAMAFLELGGQMHVCSACDQVCGVPSDTDVGGVSRHPAVSPRGMAAVLSDVAMGSSVTF